MILFSNSEINHKITEIANVLNNKHSPGYDEVVFICVLKGAFMFFTDLIKRFNFDCEIDFIQTSSYTNKEKKAITLVKDVDLKFELKNKHIYIIDDIFDTGDTISFLETWLNMYEPSSITPICLFKRATSNKNNLIYGFELTDETWIYGYGLDDENNLNRQLPEVYGEIINVD